MVNGVGVHWESDAGELTACSLRGPHIVHGMCVTSLLCLWNWLTWKDSIPKYLLERRKPMRKAEDHIRVDGGLTEGLTHPGSSADVWADCLDYSSQESAQHRLISLHPSSSPRRTWAQLIACNSQNPQGRAKLCLLRCESQGPTCRANAAFWRLWFYRSLPPCPSPLNANCSLYSLLRFELQEQQWHGAQT